MLVSKVRERINATVGLPSRSWGVTVRVVASRWVLGSKFMVGSCLFAASKRMLDSSAGGVHTSLNAERADCQ